MNNKQYLTEEKYQKFNKIFKILYLVLSLIGIGMTVGGIILLVSNKTTDYLSTEKLIGYALVIVGIALAILSIGDLFRHTFTRDIISYYTQQKMPIAKEGMEKIAPSIGIAVKEIAKGIKEGIKDEEK